MSKNNTKNAYRLLVAFLNLQAAKWPDSTFENEVKNILVKAEDIRKNI